MKPDNILVNWTCDNQGNQEVTDVALGDFDIASKLEGGTRLQTRYAIGNVMWRSPEAQTGRGVTKASDVFSFGLVVSEPSSTPRTHAKLCLQCIYAIGGGELLLLNDWKEMEKKCIKPEQEILTRHFLYFGPLRGGLFDHVSDETWNIALKKASEMAEMTAEDQPGLRFAQWGEELGPEAKNMISGMTNLDPAARATMDEALKHGRW